MVKIARSQSFYSHGEESIQVEFHTIEVYPGKVEGYLRVLTREGDFNFFLNSIEDKKLELLYQSLRKALIKVSNLFYSEKEKSNKN